MSSQVRGPRKYYTREDGTLGKCGVNSSDDDFSSSAGGNFSSPELDVSHMVGAVSPNIFPGPSFDDDPMNWGLSDVQPGWE